MSSNKKQTALSERLSKVIAEKVESGEFSYSSLARKIGATPQAVRQWALGINNVRDDFVKPLASALGRSEMWARSGVGEEIKISDEYVIAIPLIEVCASAGHGALLVDNEQVLKNIELDKAWLHRQCYFTHPDNLSVITATGDSMAPTIAHGDFLLVDQGVDAIRSDSIYVAIVNGNLYVKRFQQTPRNTLLMISDNSAYDKFELTPEQDEIKIIGKVIYHWHGEKR